MTTELRSAIALLEDASSILVLNADGRPSPRFPDVLVKVQNAIQILRAAASIPAEGGLKNQPAGDPRTDVHDG